MALEYGQQEIIRLMYDLQARKLVVVFRQDIIEDGVVITQTFPQIVSRDEDFDIILERLLPKASVRSQLETEALAIAREEKQLKIQKAKVRRLINEYKSRD
jgi:hypothetical protein